MHEHGYTEREPAEPNLSSVPRKEIEWMIEYHTRTLKNQYGYERGLTLEHAEKFIRYYERELDRRCHDCGRPLTLKNNDHVCDNMKCFLYRG